MTDPTTAVPEAGRIGALWTGLLLAPVAFLLNLELGYVAVAPSCARGMSLPLDLIHGVCLLLALVGAAIAWRCWRTEGGGWPGESGGAEARTRFLSGLGVAGSALFALVIVAQWVPTFTLHPCR